MGGADPPSGMPDARCLAALDYASATRPGPTTYIVEGNRLRAIQRATATGFAALLTLAAGGQAWAQSSSAFETRADFVYKLEVMLGIQPIYPTFNDFSDVPSSSPYYGYIEAAYHYGITDGISPGIFGPELPVTRAEAAKYETIAFGASQAAQAITATKFTDNAKIPQALVGYVGEAAALGLMKGFPNGSFQPEANLTQAQETALLSQLQAVIRSAKPTIVASSSDIAVGQQAALSMSASMQFSGGVTFQVTSANAKSAVLAGSVFAATEPGVYTVQGTVGGVSSTTTITVYGSPVALKISAPASIVANGTAESSVTVTMIDQSGNSAADTTDTIALYTNSNAAACVLNSLLTCSPAGTSAPTEAVLVNGVATFQVEGGSVAGATTGLTAVDVTDTQILNGTANLTSQPQVPTSLAVQAESPDLTANSGGYTDTFDVQVLDQTGNPMLIGSYPFTAAVSGPATFLGGSASPEGGVYVGNGTGGTGAPIAHVLLGDVTGQTGTVTLTVGYQGLTSGSAKVQAVITGAPSQIALSAAQSTNADTPATYTATIEDSQGYPVDWTGGVSLSGTDTGVPGVQFSPSGVLQFNASDTATYTAIDFTAGKYTITAADVLGVLKSGTQDLTVTAGPPVLSVITPSTPTCGAASCTLSSYVALSNPTWTETLQIYDNHGNPVPEAGVVVYFTLTPAGPPVTDYPGGIESNNGLGTINGVTAAAPNNPVMVATATNSQGVATAVMSALPFNYDDYQLSALVPAVSATHVQGAYVQLSDLAADAPITVSYQGPGGTPVYNLTANGSIYTGTFVLQDQQGIATQTQDVVQITPSGTGTVQLLQGVGGTLTANPDGSYTLITALIAGRVYGGSFNIKALRAGSVTLTYQDLNQLSVKPSTSTLSVVPDVLTRQVGFSAGGVPVTAATPLTVPAGGQVPITITTEDVGGNAIANVGQVAVGVSVSGGAGEIRSLSTGADLSPAVLTIAPGAGTATFYYSNDSTSSEQVSFDSSTVLISEGSFQPVGAGGTVRLGFAVCSGAGAPVNGEVLPVSITIANVTTSTSITSGTDGTAPLSFTAPSSGWQSGSTALVDVTAAGNLSVSVAVLGR